MEIKALKHGFSKKKFMREYKYGGVNRVATKVHVFSQKT